MARAGFSLRRAIGGEPFDPIDLGKLFPRSPNGAATPWKGIRTLRTGSTSPSQAHACTTFPDRCVTEPSDRGSWPQTTHLFLELAPGDRQVVLTLDSFTFGKAPRPVVPVRPERTTRVGEQDFGCLRPVR